MKTRVLTTIALCSATLSLLTTATPAFAAAIQYQSHSVANPKTTIKPFVDIDLSQANPIDGVKTIPEVIALGTPQVVTDPTIKGKVTSFDGNSGYVVPFTESNYTEIKNGVTLEAFFKYEGPTSGEKDIFSNQEGGGLGLGIQNGKLTFFAHDGKGYKTPNSTFKQGKWNHAVGIIDFKNHKTKLYLNGKLVGSVTNSGNFKRANSANHFMIGGDSGKDTSYVQSAMIGEVKTARIYNHVLSDAEVQQLSTAARADITSEKEVIQAFDTQLVGADDVVAGHKYSLNVHTRQQTAGDINNLEYDVLYDQDKFDFISADQLLGSNNTTVTQTSAGVLHVKTSAVLSKSEMRKYSQTKLARINLRAKINGHQNETTKLTVKNVSASVDGKDVSNPKMTIAGQQNVTIHAKNINDYNGDGIVGAGDIALAPTERKQAVAAEAKIQPYKHVIVLTTDGGGNPWDPKGMYYAKDDKTIPTWTEDKDILAKRKNTYTIDLFKNKFAMSTDAEAVRPTISAQNYSSMIHGIPWGDMDENYKMTNTSAGLEYFNDFGKEQAKYPSVFKVLQKAAPTQNMAAFSEWAPFLNGIMEPDAAIEKQHSGAFKSFDDVADYIGSDQYKDTSVVYMQSDQMDIEAHAHGWYNDNYWNHYARYDSLFKTVMDKLEATGHIHDTLVIANADHGGALHRHGGPYSNDPSNYNIFLALGGETVDAGRRIKGGSNADISSLILNALQVQQPVSMTGKVFDPSAFLSQTELAKKQRQVESINLKNGQNRFDLQFKANGNRQIRTFDAQIDLAGQSLDDIKIPEGTKVLRKSVDNGILKLTLSFDGQPTANVATVMLKAGKTRAVAKTIIKQAMLGTDKGTEILPDLINDVKTGNATVPAPSKPGTGSTATPKPDKPGTGSTATPKPDKPGTGSTATPKPDKPGTGSTATPKPDKPGTGNTATPKPDKPSTGNTVTLKPDTNSSTNTPSVSANGNAQTSSSAGDSISANSTSESHKEKPAKKNKLKGKIVYAQKKLGFYKKAKFTKKNRYKFFAAKSQSKWAQFKIVTKKGNRYQVKDINKGSKTYGKTGYITTNSKYITSADYTKKPIKVKVINAKGLSAYNSKTLKGKHTTYKRGTMLKIRKLVKSKGKLRLQLKNGKYITVDKHMIHAYFAHK
ncbi:LamG-like jellyroll fold domain-containing protein [Lactiplantibacillus songbeiensis]|uniref:LamG-like jellyroll fold domain-containing protein n=1 Tax=Lactiplantibacillus songbeiensis TaxID=2559920 RepID=A0ABW4C2Q7_9LACO|nr:LamG-like jellyroll fold domain-containing protein [Lactiplantibacillus songbeiensis]